MTHGIRINHYGESVGKARPRVSRHGTYTPRKSARYEHALRMEACRCMAGREPLDCAVAMEVTACLPIPQSWPKRRKQQAEDGLIYATKTPDVDNIAKMAADALNGVVYRDDKRITEMLVRKVYSNTPRLVIDVEPVDGEASL